MKDIVCMSGVELLMEYMEGALAPDARAAIEAHVADVPLRRIHASCAGATHRAR